MSERVFEAPGPGTWELDATHLSKPVSLYTASIFPGGLARGFKEGTERFGLFLSHLQPVFIHGFCYNKLMLAFVPEDSPPGPPPDGFFEQPGLVERFANGKKAIENKLWREDLKRWDEEIKPDSIRRNQKLQSVSPESLSTEELIQHLIDCYENLIEMWYRHHIFTIPSLIPTGLYLGKACEWAGVSPGEALELLKGSSPVSAGIAAKELGEGALNREHSDVHLQKAVLGGGIARPIEGRFVGVALDVRRSVRIAVDGHGLSASSILPFRCRTRPRLVCASTNVGSSVTALA